ncbi:hypothetical protein SLEP1_g57637 [Rubroshorea leprosula]|uniref:Uncharacterized protein n=1 Tax=Rubroshorea leprosula TaxID=152421 RepID=A0AAV5MM95_9ROSI|nr:hypothetical protein SLEP1_g57637 [Rubroshorea leprosula]
MGEFWSDVAIDRRRRNSPWPLSSSPERYFKMPRFEILKWVEECIEQIGSVLIEGGWDEIDISDIVDVSALGFFEEEMVLLDNQAVLNALLLKPDRLSDSFRKAGWSYEDVSDASRFDFRQEKERKSTKRLSPEHVEKIE